MDFFARFLVQFQELVQLDVACSMKPKQTTQTCALWSTASEARSINLERQGHWSGRIAMSDDPYDEADRPRCLKKTKWPSQTQLFIPLCFPSHTSTDQVTNSLRSSIAVSSPLLAAWGFGAAPANARDPKSNAPDVGRGAPGRTRAVARLVGCQRVFIDPRCVIRI